MKHVRLKDILFVKEMALSDGFWFQDIVSEIKSLGSPSAFKEKYRDKLISSGSYRDVYDLDGVIVKMNTEEFPDNTENENEVRIKTCGDDTYLTKIFAYDKEGYKWLITEKVQPMGSKETFVEILKPKLAGSGFMEDLGSMYDDYYGDVKIKDLGPAKFILFFVRLLESPPTAVKKPNPWLKGLMQVIKKCKINPSDLHFRNWGYRRDTDQLVILDYGYTPRKIDI